MNHPLQDATDGQDDLDDNALASDDGFGDLDDDGFGGLDDDDDDDGFGGLDSYGDDGFGGLEDDDGFGELDEDDEEAGAPAGRHVKKLHPPASVLVVTPDASQRSRLLAAVDRTGHMGIGAHDAEGLLGSHGLPADPILLFTRSGWRTGGPALISELIQEGEPPRVLMLTDARDLGRSHELEAAGVQILLGEPLSNLELLWALDELIGRQPTSLPEEEEDEDEDEQAEDREDEQDEPSDSDAWRAESRVQEALGGLAQKLRSGEAQVSNVSQVSVELSSILGDPQTTMHDVVSRIEKDPNLVASILRSANTAAYRGMPRLIDLESAGKRLGMRRLGELAQRHAVRGAFRGRTRRWGPLLGTMWRNSVVVADAARNLAVERHLQGAGDIYSLGLLHNIGQVLVCDLYKDLGYKPPDDGVARDSLAKDLRWQSPELGGLLLKSWGMPSVATNVAANLDHPEELPSGTPIARHAWLIGSVVRAVAEVGGALWEGQPLPGCDVATGAAACGLSQSAVMEAVEDALDEWEGGSKEESEEDE